VEQVADDDQSAFTGVQSRHNFAVQPAVCLIPVLFRPDPFAVLRVVHHDEFGAVLEVSQSTDLLSAAPGQNPDAIREHYILLLPLVTFALQREVLNHLACYLAVVLLDKVVRLKLMLDG
jgi:hypothetical protein